MMNSIENGIAAAPGFLEFSIFESLLKDIEKPGRYIDHEFGTCSKSPEYILSRRNTVLAALIFPDTYEVGMSNLGLQILYSIINKYEGFSAERAFSPWPDFEERLRSHGMKYFSLENRIFLDSFDLLGFNAAHEMLYTNILNIIDLSGLEVNSSRRRSIFPLICAGGSATVNPWPLSNFMDFMLIGDGEEAVVEILKVISDFKSGIIKRKSGSNGNKTGLKRQILKELSKIDGVFVPGFYRIIYKVDQTVLQIVTETNDGKASKIKKAVFRDFGRSGPVIAPLIPNIRTVHDRLNIEIMRGCGRGCRFCQAGFIYRPVRQRKVPDLVSSVREGLKNTGYDEISFTSLSSSDFRGLSELVQEVRSTPGIDRISISLPSLRLDSFSLKIAEKILWRRKTGLTFAPEAGSQRLRDLIKKDINQSHLLQSVKIAFLNGWEKIKLYFMVGLPGEEKDDIDEIIHLIEKVIQIAKETLSGRSIGRLQVNVSINAFSPKPFTPFQWAAQESLESLQKKLSIINSGVPARFVKFNWTNPKKSRVECALSRGDSRVSDVVELAWKKGAKFDNWTDFFNYDIWLESFKQCGLDIDFFSSRRIKTDEILPWDIIDTGVKKGFLLKEYRQALKFCKKYFKKECKL
ncbi:MAG: TIGR03960 family B12-binding radical SAM protein [Actinobacteria bacterium]|nr:TIGR03960 family B12-binding radical SAM protein [Actinomycetota bacterium]